MAAGTTPSTLGEPALSSWHLPQEVAAWVGLLATTRGASSNPSLPSSARRPSPWAAAPSPAGFGPLTPHRLEQQLVPFGNCGVPALREGLLLRRTGQGQRLVIPHG